MRNAVSVLFLFAALTANICAVEAETLPPGVEDPFGLGPRLALIDYLKEVHGVAVPMGATYAEVLALYTKSQPQEAGPTEDEALNADRIQRLRHSVEQKTGIAAPADADEATLVLLLQKADAKPDQHTPPATPPEAPIATKPTSTLSGRDSVATEPNESTAERPGATQAPSAEMKALTTLFTDLHSDPSKADAIFAQMPSLLPRSGHPSVPVQRPTDGKPFAWDLVYDECAKLPWADYSDVALNAAISLVLSGPADPRRSTIADSLLVATRERPATLALGLRLIENLQLNSPTGATWLIWAWSTKQQEDALLRVTAANYSQHGELAALALEGVLAGRIPFSPTMVGFLSAPNLPQPIRESLVTHARADNASPMLKSALLNAGPGCFAGSQNADAFTVAADAALTNFVSGQTERELALAITTGPDTAVRTWILNHLEALLALPAAKLNAREPTPLLSDPLILAALLGLKPSLDQLVAMPGSPWMGTTLHHQAWWVLAKRATNQQNDVIVSALPEDQRAEIQHWLSRPKQAPRPALDAPVPAWVQTQLGQDPNVDVTIIMDYPAIEGAGRRLTTALATTNAQTRRNLVERMLTRPDSLALLCKDPMVADALTTLSQDAELSPNLRSQLIALCDANQGVDVLVDALSKVEPGPNLDPTLLKIAMENPQHPSLERFRVVTGPPRQQWIAWTLLIAAGENATMPSCAAADFLNWKVSEDLFSLWKAHAPIFAAQLPQFHTLNICSNLDSRRAQRLLETWLATIQELEVAAAKR